MGVRYFAPPAPRHALEVREVAGSVPIVKTWTGMDTVLFDWWLDQGIDGIVVEGSGAGNVPGEALPGIRRLVESGIPVVLTTRCIGGPLAPIYGTGGASGGGHDLMETRVIPASRLTAQKARIALMALLGAGLPRDDIDAWFRSI
jgi:L-asparaginase